MYQLVERHDKHSILVQFCPKNEHYPFKELLKVGLLSTKPRYLGKTAVHHKNVLVKTRILTAYITALTLLNAQDIGKHNEVVILQSQYIYLTVGP